MKLAGCSSSREHLHGYVPVEATQAFHIGEKLSVIIGLLPGTIRREELGYDLHGLRELVPD